MVEKFNKNKKANISTYNKQISYVPNNKYVPTNQNKTIKDALPREVIERIKVRVFFLVHGVIIYLKRSFSPEVFSMH